VNPNLDSIIEYGVYALSQLQIGQDNTLRHHVANILWSRVGSMERMFPLRVWLARAIYILALLFKDPFTVHIAAAELNWL